MFAICNKASACGWGCGCRKCGARSTAVEPLWQIRHPRPENDAGCRKCNNGSIVGKRMLQIRHSEAKNEVGCRKCSIDSVRAKPLLQIRLPGKWRGCRMSEMQRSFCRQQTVAANPTSAEGGAVVGRSAGREAMICRRVAYLPLKTGCCFNGSVRKSMTMRQLRGTGGMESRMGGWGDCGSPAQRLSSTSSLTGAAHGRFRATERTTNRLIKNA